MKAQILKIAGVKTEAEFYKKYPSEEAFMKKHGKEFQKAKIGLNIKKAPVNIKSTTDAMNESIAQGDYLPDETTSTSKKNMMDALGILSNQAGSVVGLTQSIIGNNKKSKQLDQYQDIANLVKQAAASAPTPQKQKYVRPEDQLIQPVNPLGVQGFGYFENGGEIQNTYAPNDLYEGLGYEPLNDSNPKQYQDGGLAASANQYMSAASSLGGGLGSLAGGSDFEQTEEGQLASTILGAAGTAIGGPIGGLIGAGIGGLAGGFFGGKKKKEMKEKKQNFQNAVASATGVANIQNMNQGSAFVRNGGEIDSYEDGGYMNPEYNPQVIAKFGDYDIDQLLAPPHDADMLRAGGHLKEYTPPSASAMYTGRDLPYQMEDGGQVNKSALNGAVQTTWGGGVRTLSYNPYMPGTGETIEFVGNSHDTYDPKSGNTGIGVKYGNGGSSPLDYAKFGTKEADANVEVEKEPGAELIDPETGEKKLNIYGNLVINKFAAEHIGDPNAENKKYKHYITDLSKKEVAANKTKQKASDLAKNKNATPLELNTAKALENGADMTLAQIATFKKNAATVQDATLDTAKEFKIDADALAKGKIKYAKDSESHAEFGAKLDKFKGGGKKEKKKPEAIDFPAFDNTAMMQQLIPETRATSFLSGLPAVSVEDLPEYDTRAALMPGAYAPVTGITPSAFPSEAGIQGNRNNTNGIMALGPLPKFDMFKGLRAPQSNMIESGQYGNEEPFVISEKKSKDVAKSAPKGKEKGKGSNWWEMGTDLANSLIPYMRPSNQMELSPSQLSGEMFALSDNTLDPVYAQTYQPDYTQPMSISLQDQLNEVTAQTRAAERMASYDPAAAAAIAGQASQMKSKILGEQFRLNQAERLRAMETNRETANDAKLKNMAIFQDQATKMAQTKSIMKQQKIAALNSINEKVLKNQFENRTLAVGENLYNYRFTPNGVAYNVNPFAQFAPYGSGQSSAEDMNIPAGYEADDYMKTPSGKYVPKTLKLKKPTKTKTSDTDEYGKNGALVKAIKNL